MSNSTLTSLRPFAAVDVERQVALLVLGAEVVEDHAVGAQLLRDLAVLALVVLVALVGVREVAIGLGALVRQVGVVRRGRGGGGGDGGGGGGPLPPAGGRRCTWSSGRAGVIGEVRPGTRTQADLGDVLDVAVGERAGAGRGCGLRDTGCAGQTSHPPWSALASLG